MRDRWILIGGLIIVLAGGYALERRSPAPPPPLGGDPPATPQRIVSFAPSVTETLFLLGLGDRVVGVSRYCDWPLEVRDRPKVGGYFDPNFEAVVALRPDLVVMLVEHEPHRRALDKLGLRSLAVSHKTIDGILASLPAIGRACGAEAAAATMVADLRRRMDRIAQKTAGLSRPRVLLVIDRQTDGQYVQGCFVAGAEGYFDRLIELAGGENACRESTVRYPVVSREGLVWMDPEVIVDLSAGLVAEHADRQQCLDRWRDLAQVTAVRRERVYPLSADYAFRPGPRFIRLLEALAAIVHPEVDWAPDER